MGNRTHLYVALLTTITILLGSFLTVAQKKEKPRLKDFGSSLKRIKWDPEKKAAVEEEAKSKLKPNSKSNIEDVDVVKIETSLVTTDLLVLDSRSNPVSGLTNKDFVISEDGKAQQVAMLSLGDSAKVPRSIVLIIDYSGSQRSFLQRSIAAAKSLVDKLTTIDQMAIVTDDVELLQNFTSSKRKLKDQLDMLLERSNPNSIIHGGGRMGKSRQYSALMAILREGFHSEDQRPIVIFQTDGDQYIFLRNPLFVPSRLYHEGGGLEYEEDPALIEKRIAALRTEFSLQDVIRAAEKSRATIYTVVPGFEILGRSAEDQLMQVNAYIEHVLAAVPADRQREFRREIEKDRTPVMLRYWADALSKQQLALTAVSTASGGWTTFLETPDQADVIYSRIFADISQRYLVGYYSTNKAHDGKRRKTEFQIRDHPEYRIIGRRSYYAAGTDN